MLIQTTIEGVHKIVHEGVEYAVEKGFALVDAVAGKHLVQFPEWKQVTEDVDKKILDKLNKAKPQVQEPVADQSDQDSDQDKTETE